MSHKGTMTDSSKHEVRPTLPDGPSVAPLQPTPPNPGITAEMLWAVHRMALGGKSSATGAPLPDSFGDIPEGARRAHWAMAVAARLTVDRAAPVPPMPLGMSEETAARIVGEVQELLRSGDSAIFPSGPA